MRKFDLQRALLGAGAAAEDFEDETGAIEYLGVQRLLQIALLHGRQRVVDDDHFRLRSFDDLGEFLDLAGAEQGSRSRVVDRYDSGMNEVEVDGRARPTASSCLASGERIQSWTLRDVSSSCAKETRQDRHDDNRARFRLPPADPSVLPVAPEPCVSLDVRPIGCLGRSLRLQTSERAGSA